MENYEKSVFDLFDNDIIGDFDLPIDLPINNLIDIPIDNLIKQQNNLSPSMTNVIKALPNGYYEIAIIAIVAMYILYINIK